MVVYINKGKRNKGQNALILIFQLSKIIQWTVYGFSLKSSLLGRLPVESPEMTNYFSASPEMNPAEMSHYLPVK